MTLQIILTGKDVKAGLNRTVDSSTTPPTYTYVQFPYDTKIGTFTATANVRKLYSLGDRYMKGAIVQKFEGRVGIDMPFYDKTVVQNFLSVVPISTVVVQYPTFIRELHDFVPQIVEISIREDELVRVSVEGDFVKEEDVDVSLYSIVANEPSAAYPTHVNATITTVDGITNITIRAATIRVNLNQELKWGIGSRYAQAVALKQVDVEVTIEAILDKAMLDKVLGDMQSSVTLTFELVTDNTGSTTLATINVEDAYLNSVSEPVEPNTEVYATLTYVAKNIAIL